MAYRLDKMSAIATNLDSFERDCAITVALKITDDSCKMDDYEKSVFMMLYDALDNKTDFFDNDIFELIEKARLQPSAHIYSEIKKRREVAMDYITRPKMKAFKALMRERLTAAN